MTTYFEIINTLQVHRAKKMTTTLTEQDRIDKIVGIKSIFTPSQAIDIEELFSGRRKELEKAQETITDLGCHLIIYGDRGVGKTSLANIIKVIWRKIGETKNINVTKINCDPLENFGELWKRSLNQIPIPYTSKEKTIGYNQENKEQTKVIGLGEYITSENLKDVKSSEINDLVNRLEGHSIFIFDEFDRIEDKKTKEKFSYLIKMLSDTSKKVTIILVGIAENIADIIENHESVERCLKQIILPRMSKFELSEIIEKGLNFTEMQCNNEIKEKIIDFSEGFPQYIHLLCKHSAKAAIERGSLIIEKEDFDKSIDESLEDVQETTKESYRKAVTANDEVIFKEVLIACSFVKTDEYGNFTAKSIQKILSHILKKNIQPSQYRYHLGQLCKDERGKVLKKIESVGENRYQFRNPLLRAYSKIKAYQLRIEI